MDQDIEIKLQLNSENRGKFYVEQNNETVAEMEIAIKDGKLVVFHTEVADELKGLNIGKRLLEEMVKYARKNSLKVLPYCPFVRAQFRRHEQEYADIWQKQE